jgi:exodeoxyribonuclease VII large subunit
MPIFTQSAQTSHEANVYTVSTLNKAVRELLESKLGHINVEGEISNLVQASSGHYYFKLKDEKAQIQCAFFRFQAAKCSVSLENGSHIEARAKVSLYEPRGDYQLIIEQITPAGIGQLQLAFEALKKKLQAMGLFDEAHKKDLPKLPSCIGIITSLKAAALKDILTTLKRRFPSIPVILYPSDVQGDKAATMMSQQIAIANKRRECDVLILARGGGSIEDLWAFNDEQLAHAIYRSEIPIISGVGHEIDFTIADFCADLRAPTPTAAAECATPKMSDYLEELAATTYLLEKLLQQKIKDARAALMSLIKQLKAPEHRIYQHFQRLDSLEQALKLHCQAQLQKLKHQQLKLQARLLKENPGDKLAKQRQRYERLKQQLVSNFCHHFNQQRIRLSKLVTLLQATSPLATLDRGYAIAFSEKKALITSSKDLAIGDTFWVKLKKEELHCELKDIKS